MTSISTSTYKATFLNRIDSSSLYEKWFDLLCMHVSMYMYFYLSLAAVFLCLCFPTYCNHFWDQSTRPNDHASCKSRHMPIKFIPLASSMHFHEVPASTAVRNASNNLPHVHCLEARYPDIINVNGGGPFIQAPSGLSMLSRLDDRQTTNNNDETEVLTTAVMLSATLMQA